MQYRYLWAATVYKRRIERDSVGGEEAVYRALGKVKVSVKARTMGAVADIIRGEHGYYGKGTLVLYVRNDRIRGLDGEITLGDGLSLQGDRPQFHITDIRRFARNTMLCLRSK